MRTAVITSTGEGATSDSTTITIETTEGEGINATQVKSTYTIKVDSRLDWRSHLFALPTDYFVVVNEAIKAGTKPTYLQVIPLRYDEYTRLMSKPYKRPLKY